MATCVIGTVFVDCKGFAGGNYIPDGRNVGAIKFVHGGVGRNVAENLGRLGLPVNFVSSVDASALGQEVLSNLKDAGVNVRYVAELPERGMGMWLVVLNEKGQLAGSISQMPDLTAIERYLREHGETIVSESSRMVLEVDLNLEISLTAIELAKRQKRLIYGLPGNLEVVMQRPDLLDKLDCFVCNHIEAGRIFGCELQQDDPETAARELKKYLSAGGPAQMVVTLGAGGSVFFDGLSGDAGFEPTEHVDVVDSCGAGDAFFSGTVMGLVQGQSLRQAVFCGTRAAEWTIQSSETTCRDLNQCLESMKKGDSISKSPGV